MTDYWVTARVAQGIPQLFSAILGNPISVSSSRATAAVIDSVAQGSLILLNRENDCVPMENVNHYTCGVNLLVQANDNGDMPAVRADGGILMASTAHGTAADGRYAGENQGGGTVRSPFTYIRQQGDYMLGGGSQWIAEPDNGIPDRSYFLDPMRGKGQPPPPTGLVDRPILGGVLLGSNDPANPAVFQPGNYFAATQLRDGTVVATGEPLVTTGNIRFSSGGTSFGGYVFFGGIRNSSAGTVVNFDPGRYVFAGVKAKNAASVGVNIDIAKNMTLTDNSQPGVANSDAGELFIFTDTNYPGLEVPQMVQPVASQLVQGKSGFQSGATEAVSINLHGLNRESAALPPELKTFAPTVLWQDQANSVVKHTPDGNIDTSCGMAECPNDALRNAQSTELRFQASPAMHIYGVAYQPRGGWTSMVGGGGYDSPLMIITGAFQVQANSNVRLAELHTPLLRKGLALVE